MPGIERTLYVVEVETRTPEGKVVWAHHEEVRDKAQALKIRDELTAAGKKARYRTYRDRGY